jgi:hypothetical protein
MDNWATVKALFQNFFVIIDVMWEDLKEAQKNLDELKTSFRDFLLRTYNNKETAINTFEYLSKIVKSTIKKEAIKIEFTKGGDVSWYMSVFNYLSNWLEAEKKTSDLLNQGLAEIIEEDPNV